MALLRVGTEYPVSTPICLGEECRACREKLELGEVVEVRIRVDPPITRERSFLLIKALSKLREKIPGAAILFIEVSDDGRVVRVQLSDDPLSWATVAQIVIIIAMLIALILSAKVLIEAVFRVVTELRRTIPPRVAPVFWGGLGIALAGAGIGVAAMGLSRVVPWRRR